MKNYWVEGNLLMKGEIIEQVRTGEIINSNGSCTDKIRSRIPMGKEAFQKWKNGKYSYNFNLWLCRRVEVMGLNDNMGNEFWEE